MFLGRIHRKKRKLLLSSLHAPQKTRRVMSWSRPVHNAAGIERNWWESTLRSHASSCGCGNFVNHINVLANRYGFTGSSQTPGGPRPRPPTVSSGNSTPTDTPRPALPWHGDTGGEGASGDRREGGDGGGAGGDYAPEDLDALFDALDEE